jgi:hypothetical protein
MDFVGWEDDRGENFVSIFQPRVKSIKVMQIFLRRLAHVDPPQLMHCVPHSFLRQQALEQIYRSPIFSSTA